MLGTSDAFCSFSAGDLNEAQQFYAEKLGLNARITPEGLALDLTGGLKAFIYKKSDHSPASFTVLNFKVSDIAAKVKEMAAAGIEFERYEGSIATDETGIFWSSKDNNGPNIAWFKDPAGNIHSVIESK